MTSDYIANKILDLESQQAWIYRFVLPTGHETPGPAHKGLKNVMKTRVIQGLDLKGKKVLDVGSAEGMFSFYMAAEGAKVTGIELNEKRHRKAEFLKQQLGVNAIDFVLFDAEDSESWSRIDDNFDVGFCFSVLHRVSDPFNLIAQLSAKCNTLVFEWKAPEGFLTNKLSLAFHEVEGKMDPRNIRSRAALTSNLDIMDTGEEKPYWCPTIGAVKEISSSFGYDTFKVVKISKFKFLRVVYAYMDLLQKILFTSKKPISWRRYQRVMMICTRKSRIDFDPDGKIKRAPWDGTEH
jgi:SAM-dependent methyltransferase